MSERWRVLISREGVDIPTISAIDPVFYDAIWKYSGKRSELFFTLLDRKVFTHYIAIDPVPLGRWLYRKYFSSPRVILAHYRRGTTFLKRAESSAKYWTRRIRRDPSSRTLRSALREFRREFAVICRIYSIISFLAIESWQVDAQRVSSAPVERARTPSSRRAIELRFSKPWKLTALMELQRAYQRGVRPSTLAKRFQFLRSWSVVWYHEITPQWITRSAAGVPKSAREARGDRTLPRLNLTNEERTFLAVAPYMTFFKDWRDDVRRKFVFLWSPLFDVIANALAVKRNDLGYFTLDEITRSITQGKIDRRALRLRKSTPCIVTIRKEADLTMRVVVPPGRRYLTIMRGARRLKADVVTGIVASRGRWTGPVAIVRSYHDLKRVRTGDVLVANTTHPNYLPAMRLAGAFVTNEGGIISHAAIVAREMEKPCIVGTKHATSMFRDGDRVEVDATKGIVRKL